jgi:2-oxoisovalerate dehydrogenase E1 component
MLRAMLKLPASAGFSDDFWTHVRSDVVAFAGQDRHRRALDQALRIRAVETVLLDLFGKGKLHGTIHTCIGQELIGPIVCGKLRGADVVTSNHRCHGHFIGATDNWRGLVDEIAGVADGVCGGIGSSQHLYAKNFLSNGPQGALLPVAAGISLDRKRRGQRDVVVSFIGEGTLGEGVLYETMNLASLWALPHVIVCENNFYAQSTPQSASVAGDIEMRAAAFGLFTAAADTWHPDELERAIGEAIDYARSHSRPAFLTVKTYRLSPHSKGDDLRSRDELALFATHDPLNILLETDGRLKSSYDHILEETADYASSALTKPTLSAKAYLGDQLPPEAPVRWSARDRPSGDAPFGRRLNRFYADYMQSHHNAYFIGEDIDDPYGGAFKIANGLQSNAPDRVLTTPISEAAITGVGIGLALTGNRPLVEIMFGDFLTLAFDQIVNNASKIFHMYGKQLSCPLVVRTPMGGHRGYGPTHSQSLERFFIGIDNCLAISLNSLIEPVDQLSALSSLDCPAIIFENKVDYTLRPYGRPDGYVAEVTQGAAFPTIRIRPQAAKPTLTIVSYGGIGRFVADHLLDIFDAIDLIPELIVPVAIHPLHLGPIIQSVAATRRLAIIEEGATFGGVGAEIATQVTEALGPIARIVRVGGRPVPIPSAPALEAVALPSLESICGALQSLHEPRNVSAA